jgi:SRSO17 transposase
MDRRSADDWRYVSWGSGTKRPLAAHFFALRVRPKHARHECWLLCERRESGERKAYFSNVPASASLEEVVALTHGRWPIEQQYREFKDDLGLDHFEGRSYTGWNHHAVLAALTFTFIQLERRQQTEPAPTFPAVRNLVREIVTIQYLFTRPDLLEMLTRFQGRHPLRN